jgi:class 3 adenylate cyclase
LGEDVVVTRAEPDQTPGTGLTTVVFVDIVGSTPIAARLGDERWVDLLERFQAIVRGELANAGGLEMDTAGDGFFVVFADSAAAASFGCAVGKAVEPLGLQVRVGIHTGTCRVAGQKCSGLTVSIGARIVASADPDEVLVSSAVEEHLVGDARFALRKRGETELAGVPGRWPLFSVAPALPAEATGSSRRDCQ